MVSVEGSERRSAPGSLLEKGSAWMGFRSVDRAIVLAHVADVLEGGARCASISPAEVLAAVCEATAAHLGLVNVVWFRRVAGQSRTIVWSARGTAAASRLTARERAWTAAATLFEEGAVLEEERARIVNVAIQDERLGLSALFHAESTRDLDRLDRELVAELLRRLMGVGETR
jgi:hypothetical protein